MKYIQSIVLFSLAGLLIIACDNSAETRETSLTEGLSEESYETGQVREIFYNMYLPEEMSRIFEQVGANFDPDIPVSPENFSRYQEPVDIAIAIGAYGVDLNYARLFDQTAMAASYFSVIQILSEKLGIPEEYYEDLFNRIKEGSNDRDSIAMVASRIYKKTDQYLIENSRGASAALIVMGGWVEALYIGSRIYRSNPSNMEMLDRISEQKYSLNSLIFLMSNYQDNLLNARYLLYLKRLKKAFDQYEIYFEEEGFDLDTANRMILASDYTSDMTEEIALEITRLIREIREEIIE